MSVDHSFDINDRLLYTHSSTDTLKMVLTKMLKDKTVKSIPDEARLIIIELKNRCILTTILLKLRVDSLIQWGSFYYTIQEITFSTNINKVD